MQHKCKTGKTKNPCKHSVYKGFRFLLAVWTRLELATLCVTGRYSNQLNYQTNFGALHPKTN
jgi:hypothetical protein